MTWDFLHNAICSFVLLEKLRDTIAYCCGYQLPFQMPAAQHLAALWLQMHCMHAQCRLWMLQPVVL